MDKGAIKTFAVESRRKLMEDVEYKMSLLGITKDEIAESISTSEGVETFNIGGSATYSIYDEDIKKRERLIQEVNNKGFENVVEEVAYTWFNRIIAIRFMEVNHYLPSKVRVLSSETPGKIEPDIIAEAFNIDLDYSDDDKELIFKLKDENKLDELFRFLFVKQCNKLNDILPGLFEKTEDYMELLLNISFTSEDGVVRQLIENISEEDFTNQVEIIGWLYQYYNSELKDKVNNALKSKPINKNEIPAATQLFTPDWIVKYMVDNSLGRYWIERNSHSSLKNYLDYYLDEADQAEDIKKQLDLIRNESVNIEEIKFFDPCMGSAHILIYAFDIFMNIYKEKGYSEREIPELILKNNLYGLDIDKRAYQLAYFAVLMKARFYDRKILFKNISLNLFQIKSSCISKKTLNYIVNFNSKLGNYINYLNDVYTNADEFGSLIKLEDIDLQFIETNINKLLNDMKKNNLDLSIFYEIKHILDLIKQSKLLLLKYQIVVTNPPYLNKFDKSLKDFSKKYYNYYSKDLFSMFMYRNFDFCTYDGFSAFMTPMVWMFIKSFEKLRKFIINNKTIISLIELEYMALWEIDAHVPVCTFIFSNYNFNKQYNSIFLKLSEFNGGIEVQNKKVLSAINKNVDYKYLLNQSNFDKIPGSPIAYWADKHVFEAFEKGTPLHELSNVKVGLQTGENDYFLRYWFEVDYHNIGFSYESCVASKNSNLKWFPHNKGGKYKKWYGNQNFVINFENDGFELENFKKANVSNRQFQFKSSICWSRISSSNISFRYFPKGFLFDSATCAVFLEDISDKYYILALLNSIISQSILEFIAPTLNYQAGDIALVPCIFNDEFNQEIKIYVHDNIQICKNDWDDYETSWDFKSHPLLRFKGASLKESFNRWTEHKLNDFNKLKSNETKLNEIFSEIYSIDINSNVEDKHVSVTKADYKNDIKSFISYAIGCMFGRYSLNEECLQFAGGNFNINEFNKDIVDEDNIIPVLDTEYFEDDIVGKLVNFVKICFGEESLEENLDFIAGALNSKSNKSSREIIREYLLKDFFKDHSKIYNKRPIYWMFNSGKQNGFSCLVYIHRYEPDLVARVRTDYLHKTQKAIEQNIDRCNDIINSDSKNAKIIKEKNKLEKQLQETREYDEALAHIANQNIELDLDDGVKMNYDKFQSVEVTKEGQKNKKIKLLKNI